jgi:N-acylglucosamine-6-phosphate 2-epimerase
MSNSRLPFHTWFPQLKGHLIVSCQALAGEALFGAEMMSRMALAAQRGGAAAIRANSPADISAIRQVVDLPIFGLFKIRIPGFDVYITPTLEHARQVADAGADVICIDATNRPHPDGLPLKELVKCMHTMTGLPIMADISTLAEGIYAQECGFELVSTTLAGYTPYSQLIQRPDTRLVAELARRLPIPVLAEGRYQTPQQAARAIRLGAYAVVVGGAITRPTEITQRFAKAIAKIQNSQ